MKNISYYLIVLLALFMFSNVLADSPRMCVVEEFSSTSSLNSASVNVDLHAYFDENINHIIPIIYHLNVIGKTFDPIFMFDSIIHVNRAHYYQNYSMPTGRINGSISVDDALFFDRLLTDSLMTEMSPIDMSVSLTKDGDSYQSTVTVKSSADIGKKTLRFIVAESYITLDDLANPADVINGETEFHWTPRFMLPDDMGSEIDISANSEQSIDFSFDRKEGMKDGNIYVIAFIQDDTSKEILQGAVSDMPEAIQLLVNHDAGNPVMMTPTEPLIITYTISNPESYPVEFEITLPEREGWTVAFDAPKTTLGAGESMKIAFEITTDKSGDYAIFTPYIHATADGVIPYNRPVIPSINILLNTTKVAFYAPLRDGPAAHLSTIEALENSESVAGNYALLGCTRDKFNTFPVDMFETIIFAFDFYNSLIPEAMISISNFGSDRVADQISKAIDAGVNVLFISERDLQLYRYGTSSQRTRSKKLDTLFDKLGIVTDGSSGTFRIYTTEQGQIIGGKPYTMTGNFPDGTALKLDSDLNLSKRSYDVSVCPDNFITTRDEMNVILTYDDNQKPAAAIGSIGASNYIFGTSVLGAATTSEDKGRLLDFYMKWLKKGAVSVEEQYPKTGMNIYPNPIHNTATLSYRLDFAANVTVTVVDVTGKLRNELVNELKPAGEYEINLNSDSLASGIYFALININGNIASQAMIISK